MVYILHFDKPYHHAQHYVGYTSRTPAERLQEHRAGRGNALVKAVSDAGIDIEVATTLPGGRTEERQIKNQKNTKRFCPICQKEHEVDDHG